MRRMKRSGLLHGMGGENPISPEAEERERRLEQKQKYLTHQSYQLHALAEEEAMPDSPHAYLRNFESMNDGGDRWGGRWRRAACLADGAYDV